MINRAIGTNTRQTLSLTKTYKIFERPKVSRQFCLHALRLTILLTNYIFACYYWTTCYDCGSSIFKNHSIQINVLVPLGRRQLSAMTARESVALEPISAEQIKKFQIQSERLRPAGICPWNNVDARQKAISAREARAFRQIFYRMNNTKLHYETETETFTIITQQLNTAIHVGLYDSTLSTYWKF